MDRWRLIGGGSEGRLVIWNHTTGKEVYALDEWTNETSSQKRKQADEEKEVENVTEMKDEEEKDKEKETGSDDDGDDSKECHGKAITGIAFDDSYIVAGGTDGKLRIWDYTYQGTPK